MSSSSTNPNNSYNYDPYDFNTKWSDIDVHLTYQFDNQPTNIVQVGNFGRGGTGGRGANGDYNDLYQVSYRLQNKQLKGYQSWMNWFQKIQPDYKFLVVDEKNAQTVVFQNVDDPWMFTQYIYKGIGKVYYPFASQSAPSIQGDPYNGCQLDYPTINKSIDSKQYVVIQPGFYDFLGNPINQAAKDLDNDKGYQVTSDDTSQQTTSVKSYKKVRDKGWYKKQFGQYQQARYTTGADGSILYRGQICVECNKWGQHGNVPAHAINMIAPKDYVQGNTKLVLRAMTKTTYGVPIYVDQFGYGYITTKDGKYYVNDNLPAPNNQVLNEDGSIKSLATATYTVPENGSGNQIVKNFTKTTSPKIKVRMIGTDIVAGDIIYNGCKYFGKVKDVDSTNKIIGCTLQKNMTHEQKQYAKCSGDCKSKNTKCKYFVQRGKTIAYRYQCLPTNYNAQDDDTSAQMQRIMAMSVMGGATGAAMGLSQYASMSNRKNYDEVNGYSQTTQTTYQYVQQPLNGIQVYLPPNSQNNKGAVIKRGTGQSAFEKPGLRVRSIYDGDMSQINYHRWLNKILPCYNKKYCNQTVGANQVVKSPAYTNSGCSYMYINQNNQIVNTTNPFCPYYNQGNKYGIGCPYATVNKTAMDYARITNYFYDSFYSTYANTIANFFLNLKNSNNGTTEQQYCTQQIYAKIAKDEINQQGSGTLVIYVYYSYYKIMITKDETGDITKTITDQKNFSSSKQAIIQLSKKFGLQQQVLQKSRKNTNDDSDFFLCTIKLQAENFKISKITDGDGQKIPLMDLYIRYNAYDLGDYSQSGASKPSLIGKWFVRVQKASLPLRDPTVIDNQIKFLGGYHPQYSAHPAAPQQILYKKQVPYEEQDAAASKADESQFGSAVVGTQKQVQYGYFVQQTGNWLINEQSVGNKITEENISNSIDGRAQNPAANYDGGTCIGDRWQNSLIDPQAQKPQMKRIKNCIFYTNDTASSIQYLRKNPPEVTGQDDEQPQKVPVSISCPQALPLQRSGYAYCSTCDTVLALRFLKINFNSTPKDQVGENGNMRCPWCGNQFTNSGKGVITKLPRTKAMGRVVVWGLPGTIIKTDSYFWKSPTMVNNALISQMKFKLGSPSTLGGGYSKTDNSKDSENVDSVPFIQDLGKYSKGIIPSIYSSSSSGNSNSSGSLSSSTLQLTLSNRVASNPNIPAKILESVGFKQSVDNRIIDPYKKLPSSVQGLSMVSMDYITSLRNLLQPTLGYFVGKRSTSGGVSYMANGDVLSQLSQSPSNPGQYQMYRVKYDDRKQLSFVKYWVKKRCACAPIVLAYAGDENNQTVCKVQYPSGDPQVGNFVKYFPPDPKWWYKKQWVGGIKMTQSGNPFHFDASGGGFYYDTVNAYGGIKDKMNSQCYILPHGFVPLDKQVVAAYLYYQGSQQDLYQPSIGQVQWPSGYKRISYLHFHPFTTQHESHGQGTNQEGQTTYGPHKHEIDDNLVYDDYDFNNPADVERFKQQRNIIDKDDIGPKSDVDFTKHKLVSYFDKYGDKYYIDQKLGIPIYYRLYEKRHPQYFIKTQDIHQFKWMQDNLPHSSLAKQTNMATNAGGINYTHQSKNFGKAQLPDCLKWDGFGTDIIQTKSENQIWKNYTKQQFEKMQDRYMAHIQLQIDIGDSQPTTYSFDQYYNQFNGVLQQEMQTIPGYFDLSTFNSSGYLKKYQNKSTKSTSIQGQYQQFIVTQATTQDHDTNINAGDGDLLFDITSKFKKIYNDRVERQYHGKLSQKSIQSTLQQTYESKWTGIKSQSNQSKTWSKNFNNRLKQSSYYVLNADYWYPKTNSDGVFQNSINGQKIQFNISKLYVSNKTKTFYKKTGNTITVSCTFDSTTKSKEYTISAQFIQAKQLVSYMNQVLKQAGSSNIIVQQNAGNISYVVNKITKNQTDVFPTVSFSFSGIEGSPSFTNLGQDCNRVIQCSGYSDGKHPKGLTHFTKTGEGLPNPTSNEWITKSIKQQPQQVVFDLLQAPFETQRRDYLADAGSISYQQSKCKNADCSAYNQLQGIYAKVRGTSVGSTCVSCGAKLDPIVKDSDGINSWWYTQTPQSDVVIAGLSISQGSHTSSTPFTPVSVYVSSDNQQWQCILSLAVKSSGTTKNHTYNSIYQTNNTADSSTTTKTYTQDAVIDFLGTNETQHGKLIRGRYLKIVTMPQPYTVSCSSQSYSIGSNTVTFNKQQIDGLGVTKGQLIGQQIQVTVTKTKEGETTTYTVNRVVRNNDGNVIYIDPIEAEVGYTLTATMVMKVTMYYSKISKFKAFGGAYIKSKLVITPPPNKISGQYSWQVPINTIPLQFFKVAACIGNYQQIPLQQVLKYSDIENVGFKLRVQSQTFSVNTFNDDGIITNSSKTTKTIKYYAIQSGGFYFDVGKKRLILPRYGFTDTLILQKPFGQKGASTQQLRPETQFQKNSDGKYKIPLKYFGANLQKYGLYKYITPTKYSATMWDGTQGGVEVQITANGRGPSYQVQRGAVCEIVTPLPSSGATTPLPNSVTTTYSSYAAVNEATSQLTNVPWIVYNRELISLPMNFYDNHRGNFVRNLIGTQLYQNNATYWQNNIVGTNCQKFIGTVGGTVILKGKPNTCLYLTGNANFVVKAPKQKKRYIGTTLVKQRTGGLKVGFRIAPKPTGSQRVAVGYNIPYIVVYLKQRYVDDALTN